MTSLKEWLVKWPDWRPKAVSALITIASLALVLALVLSFLLKFFEDDQTKRGVELVHDFVGNLPTNWEFYAVIALIALAYCWRRRKKLCLDQEADDVLKTVGRATDRAKEWLVKWPDWRPKAVSALITIASLALVLALVLSFLLKFFEDDQTKRGGELVHDFVGNLPTNWEFYAVIALIALAYCWRRRKKLCLDQEADDVSKTVDRASDRAVVRDLRRRALSSRLWAEVLLGGVIASLFVGLYFSIYVSRYVADKDTQVVVNTIIQERFGREIAALEKGEYWLRIATVNATGIPSLRVSPGTDGKELILGIGGRGGASTFVSQDRGFTWEKEDKDGQQKATWELVILRTEAGQVGTIPIVASLGEKVKITVAEYGASGHGLVATNDGAAYVTNDGGENWRRWTRQELGLWKTEWLAEAVVGETGPRVVVGDEGSVRFFADDAWKSADVELESRVTAFEFSADGLHGLIGTRDEAVYVTDNGGENWRRWTRRELGLKEDERLVRAVVSGNGPRVVVGDEGSVRFFADDAWKSADVELESRVTAFEFSADGLHGLIGTRDGAAYVTDDGGEKWRQWTWRELGLKENERLVGAVVEGNGPRVVVGREGSVRLLDDGTRKSADVELESRVTAFEFSADGLHGLIGTRDGAAYVTDDGGKKWRRWTRRELGLKERERLVEAVVGGNGPRVVVGNKGSVTTFANSSWTRRLPDGWTPVSNDEGELLLVNVLSHVVHGESESKLAVVPASENVWFKKGQEWEQLPVDFRSEESVEATAFDEEGNPIVVGNKGSAHVRGVTWQSSSEYPIGEEEETGHAAVASLDGALVLAVVHNNDQVAIYHSNKYSQDDTRRLVADLPEESELRGRIGTERLAQLARLGRDADRDGQDSDGSRKPMTFLEEIGLDPTFWMRFVAMAATIYFVQLLVRLYQYSIRLAAFWDSRADAILLNKSLSDLARKPSFDELVVVIGPDSFDFKPPRFPSRPWTTGSK